MMSLGAVEHPVTQASLDKIRDVRREKAELLKAGIDPVQARKQPRPIVKSEPGVMTQINLSHSLAGWFPTVKADPGVMTFEQVALTWWDRWRTKIKNPQHVQQVLSRLQRLAFPEIGDTPISDIDTDMILQVLDNAEQHSHDQAKRLLSDLRRIMKLAALRKWSSTNLLYNVQPDDVFRYQHKVQNYQRVSIAEMPELLNSINSLDNHFHSKHALLLLAYLAVRPGELKNARWDELDLDNGLWTIPAERMKLPRGHIVPLSSPAVEIFRELEQFKYSPMVFPNEWDQTRGMSTTAWLKVLYKLGYHGRMTLHGFRGVFSTAAYEARIFDPVIIEACLAHFQGSQVAKAYNHAIHLDERRKIMDWWGNKLSEMIKK